MKKAGAKSLPERLEGREGALLLAILAALGALYYIHVFDMKLLPGDEGVALMNGWRLSMGEVPHRDFFVIVPPVSFLPTAAAFKLFGPSVAAGRTLAFLMAIALVLLVDLLVRKFGGGFFMRLLSLSVLVPYGVSYWPIPSHHWWADIFCLLSAVLLVSALDASSAGPVRRTRAISLFAGISAALAALSLQDQGAYFILLVSGFLAWRSFAPGGAAEEKASCRGVLGFAAAGVLLTVIPFAGWLLWKAGFGALWHDLAWFPLNAYRQLEGHKTGITAGWGAIFGFLSEADFFRAPVYFASMLASAVFLLSLPLLGLASLILGALSRRTDPAKLFFPAWALFVSFLLASLHRWSFTNLVWAVPGILPCLALIPPDMAKRTLRCFCSFFAIAFIAFSACFLRLSPPERMIPVCGRAGCVRTFISRDSRSLAEATAWLSENTSEGQTLFCCGFKGLVNFLPLLKNPTPYNDFVDYNTPAQFAGLEKAAESGRIDWVFIPKGPSPTNEKVEEMFRRTHILKFENGSCRIYGRSP